MHLDTLLWGADETLGVLDTLSGGGARLVVRLDTLLAGEQVFW